MLLLPCWAARFAVFLSANSAFFIFFSGLISISLSVFAQAVKCSSPCGLRATHILSRRQLTQIPFPEIHSSHESLLPPSLSFTESFDNIQDPTHPINDWLFVVPTRTHYSSKMIITNLYLHMPRYDFISLCIRLLLPLFIYIIFNLFSFYCGVILSIAQKKNPSSTSRSKGILVPIEWCSCSAELTGRTERAYFECKLVNFCRWHFVAPDGKFNLKVNTQHIATRCCCWCRCRCCRCSFVHLVPR